MAASNRRFSSKWGFVSPITGNPNTVRTCCCVLLSPLPSPRSSQGTLLSSRCCAEASYQLFHTQSRIHVSATLSIRPTLSFSRFVHVSILYSCPLDRFTCTNFFRFHMYVLIHSIFFSLSDLLHSVISRSPSYLCVMDFG